MNPPPVSSSARLRESLLRLLWQQWSALGVAGQVSPNTRSIVDPEALLLVSTVFARHDARLFDEIFDWLLRNGEWVNALRLVRIQAEHHLGDETVLAHPYLKFPGSARLRTLPDGLWLNFGGSPNEPFVDIFAIEACATMSNLLDKRSRFAPSTQSFLAVCPVAWLLAPIAVGDPTPRWRATGVLRAEPTAPLVLPIRDVRVMYALRSEHYRDFARNQVPQPHEYFLPMDRLTQYDAHQDPAGLRCEG